MKASGLSFGSTARLKAKLWLGKSRPELMNTVSRHWTISELGTHLAPSHQDSTRLRSASLNSSDSLIECFILHLHYYNAFLMARLDYSDIYINELKGRRLTLRVLSKDSLSTRMR